MSRPMTAAHSAVTGNALPDRLKAFRRASGLTQQALADALGLRKSAVCNWEAGRSRPDLDLIPALCRTLGIPTAVFFCEAEALSGEEESLLKDFRALSAAHRVFASRMLRELRLSERMPSAAAPASMLRLPLAEDAIAAGTGDPLAFEGTFGSLFVRETALSRRADCVFTVNGESMAPDYPDGCRVLVQSDTALRPGETGVFQYDGSLYLKVLRPDGLYSLNPDYAVLPFGENTDCRAIGRVLGILNESDMESRA